MGWFAKVGIRSVSNLAPRASFVTYVPPRPTFPPAHFLPFSPPPSSSPYPLTALFKPGSILGFGNIPCGKPQRLKRCFNFTGREFIPVGVEKCSRSDKSSPFIPVAEWAILDNPKGVAAREIEKGRLSVSEKILRFSQGGIQKSLITDSGSSTVIGQEPVMDGEDEHLGEPKRLLHFASSFSVLR